MLLSPVDFANFSAATGIPYPATAEARARLVPAVLEFQDQQERQQRQNAIAALGLGALGLGGLAGGGLAYLGRPRPGTIAAANAAAQEMAPAAAAIAAPQSRSLEEDAARITEALGNTSKQLQRVRGEAFGSPPAALGGVPPQRAVSDATGAVRDNPASLATYRKRATDNPDIPAYGITPGVAVFRDDYKGSNLGEFGRTDNPAYNIYSEQTGVVDALRANNYDPKAAIAAIEAVAQSNPKLAAGLARDLLIGSAVNPSQLNKKTKQGAGPSPIGPYFDYLNEVNPSYQQGLSPFVANPRALARKAFGVMGVDGVEMMEGFRPLLPAQSASQSPTWSPRQIIAYDNVVPFDQFLGEAGVIATPDEAVRMRLALSNADLLGDEGFTFAKEQDYQRALGPDGGRIVQNIIAPRVDPTGTVYGFSGESRVPIGRLEQVINPYGQTETRIVRDDGRFTIVPDAAPMFTAVQESLNPTDMYTKGSTEPVGFNLRLSGESPLAVINVEPADIGGGRTIGNPNIRTFPLRDVRSPSDQRYVQREIPVIKEGQKIGTRTEWLPLGDDGVIGGADNYTEIRTPEQATLESKTRRAGDLSSEVAFLNDLQRVVTPGPLQLLQQFDNMKAAQATGIPEVAAQEELRFKELALGYANGQVLSSPDGVRALRNISQKANEFGVTLVQPYLADAIDIVAKNYDPARRYGPDEALRQVVSAVALPKAQIETTGFARVPQSLVNSIEWDKVQDTPETIEAAATSLVDKFDRIVSLPNAAIQDQFAYLAPEKADTPYGRATLDMQAAIEGSTIGVQRVDDPRFNRALASSPEAQQIFLSQDIPIEEAYRRVEAIPTLSPEDKSSLLGALSQRSSQVPFFPVDPRKMTPIQQAVLNKANEIGASRVKEIANTFIPEGSVGYTGAGELTAISPDAAAYSAEGEAQTGRIGGDVWQAAEARSELEGLGIPSELIERYKQTGDQALYDQIVQIGKENAARQQQVSPAAAAIAQESAIRTPSPVEPPRTAEVRRLAAQQAEAGGVPVGDDFLDVRTTQGQKQSYTSPERAEVVRTKQNLAQAREPQLAPDPITAEIQARQAVEEDIAAALEAAKQRGRLADEAAVLAAAQAGIPDRPYYLVGAGLPSQDKDRASQVSTRLYIPTEKTLNFRALRGY